MNPRRGNSHAHTVTSNPSIWFTRSTASMWTAAFHMNFAVSGASSSRCINCVALVLITRPYVMRITNEFRKPLLLTP